MALNDRHLRIMRSIAAGNTTGESLVDDLGSSMQMLAHFLNNMVEEGYVKAARVYDNELRDFVVVKAYLTPEGLEVLKNNPALPVAAEPAPTTSNLDFPAIALTLNAIAPLIPQLPEDWEALVSVYFSDLSAELEQLDRRRPIRIKAYFLSLLRSVLPILPKLPNGDEWTTQARQLSQQLHLPVRLPGD